MMDNKTKAWLLWGLAVVPMLMTLVAYPFLPDVIPLHWNALGEVDGMGTKFPGAFLIPGVCLLIPALMTIVPKFDPRRENYEKFGGAYYWMKVLLVVVFGFINAIVLMISLGMDFIRVDYAVKFLVGLLILLLGNIMPKFKHNYFVGIKTPWTFASEKVWFETHRHGGKVWFLAGIVMCLLAFIPGTVSAAIYFGVVMAAAFEPIVYSYIRFSRKKDA